MRLNKAGRVLQASGPESDVVKEQAELAHCADVSTVEQTGRSPESRPYVLGKPVGKGVAETTAELEDGPSGGGRGTNHGARPDPLGSGGPNR